MHVGRYEILAPIGNGGSGMVFRARAPDGAPVAVKVLRRGDPLTAARLARELELHRGLGAGFVPIIEAGDSPQGAFVVMPLVTGGTLRDRIARGPMPVAESVRLAVTIAATLGRAHAAGIIHRDLKPENVLFDGERPLVADLGLAKAVGASDGLSKTGETRGTFGYMPPEQMTDAKHTGPSADVFALGVVTYECLAGHPPFRGESALVAIEAVDAGRFEPLRKARPDVPRAIAAVVERAFTADPASRFEDGAAFAHALETASRRGAERSRWIFVALLVALALAAAGAAALHERPGPGPPPPGPVVPPVPPVAAGPRLSTIAVLGTTTLRHGAPVTVIVPRPGRDEVLVGDAQGFVRSWRVPDGAELAAHGVFRPGEVRSLAPLSDGRILALGSTFAGFAGHRTDRREPSIACVAPEIERLATIDATKVLALAAAPRGPRFATISPERVTIYDLERRATLLDCLPPDGDAIGCAAFRDENTLVIGTHRGRVLATTIAPEKAHPPLGRHAGPIRSLASSRDGRYLAAIDGVGAVHFFEDDAETGAIPEATIRAVTFAPDGRAALITQGDDFFFATLAAGRRKTVQAGREIPIDPRAGIASVSHERMIYTVAADPKTGNPVILGKPRDAGHERLVSALVALPGRRIVSAGGDGAIRIWELDSGREVASTRAHSDVIVSLTLSLDGRRLTSVGQDKRLLVSDLETLAPIASRTFPYTLLTATATPDGTLWAATPGMRAISEQGSGRPLTNDFMASVMASMGGDRIAAWGEREVRLYEATNGTALWTKLLGMQGGSWHSIARVGEDRIALGDVSGRLHLVELLTGASVWPEPVTLTEGRIAALAGSPDGRFIAAAGPPGHDVLILSAADGSIVAKAELPSMLDFPTTLAFLHGELLVGTLRGTIVRMKLH